MSHVSEKVNSKTEEEPCIVLFKWFGSVDPAHLKDCCSSTNIGLLIFKAFIKHEEQTNPGENITSLAEIKSV